MQKNKKPTFPKSFFWGAAVSAHQVEGGNYNQWSVWELENAKVLATQAPSASTKISLSARIWATASLQFITKMG